MVLHPKNKTYEVKVKEILLQGLPNRISLYNIILTTNKNEFDKRFITI